MNNDNKNAINQRRKFLEMVSKAGISTSLLRASPIVAGLLANRYAEAASAVNKRVLLAFMPGGIIPGTWMPSGIGSMNKSTMALGAVAPMCNFYQVDMGGGGHGGAHFALGGKVSNTSIDAMLANTDMGSTRPYSRLALGVETGSNDLIGMVPGSRIQPYNDPKVAYNQLFAAPPPPGQADAIYRKQKAALDTNLEAMNAIKLKIGQEEKIRLESHVAAIQKLDARLLEATKPIVLAGCTSPTLPSEGAAGDAFTKTVRLQVDVALAAFQCGLTNIVSLQLSNTQCDWIYNGSFSSGHHEAIHGRGANDNIEIENYLSAQSAYIIKRLAETPDPIGGNMLIDNTVYLRVCDFGNGGAHDTSGAPAILATKMAGFSKGTVGGGGSHLSLLRTLATGLGYADVAAKFAG